MWPASQIQDSEKHMSISLRQSRSGERFARTPPKIGSPAPSSLGLLRIFNTQAPALGTEAWREPRGCASFIRIDSHSLLQRVQCVHVSEQCSTDSPRPPDPSTRTLRPDLSERVIACACNFNVRLPQTTVPTAVDLGMSQGCEAH